MNITVFGASGGIGGHVVALAAQHGHDVRAVYRATPPAPLPGQAEILIAPDIFDPAFAAEGLGQPGQHLRAAIPDRRRGQLVPAAEIVVELALARPRRRQHLIHAGGRDPALGEQVRGPLHDPLPAGAPAPGLRLTRHPAMLAADCTRQSRTSGLVTGWEGVLAPRGRGRGRPRLRRWPAG